MATAIADSTTMPDGNAPVASIVSVWLRVLLAPQSHSSTRIICTVVGGNKLLHAGYDPSAPSAPSPFAAALATIAGIRPVDIPASTLEIVLLGGRPPDAALVAKVGVRAENVAT